MTRNDTLHEPAPARLTRRIETSARLDAATKPLSAVAGRLTGSKPVRSVLQGDWLGHAVHPVLTDLPIGLWTSATVLDLIGGRSRRDASQLLVALGVAGAVPTAITGLAEYAHADQEERRVGLVHAAANNAALALYVSSLVARRAGRHRTGVLLGLAGGAAMAAGGYLGGHLIAVRKLASHGSRHEAGPGGDTDGIPARADDVVADREVAKEVAITDVAAKASGAAR